MLYRCKSDLEYDPEWHWPEALSPGEAQRLAFLRLFYHRPDLAFLDEATSAISVDLEEALMRRCADLGITLVSVAHRESVRRFHDWNLQLGLGHDGTSWQIVRIER